MDAYELLNMLTQIQNFADTLDGTGVAAYKRLQTVSILQERLLVLN